MIVEPGEERTAPGIDAGRSPRDRSSRTDRLDLARPDRDVDPPSIDLSVVDDDVNHDGA